MNATAVDIEEEGFQAALDENPGENTTRLVFADWLEERDDPRALGYRALGLLRRCPVMSKAADWSRGDWSWYFHDPDYSKTRYRNGLPRHWSRAIGNRHVHATRREADDTAALAFSKLTTDQQDEILKESS